MLEQGRDFWRWFDTTQFSYHCVHPIHAKMFSIQMLLHFSQIVPRVCTTHYIEVMEAHGPKARRNRPAVQGREYAKKKRERFTMSIT